MRIIENVVLILQCPPNSVDFFPIENFWDALKEYSELKSPECIDKLKEESMETKHVGTLKMRFNLMLPSTRRLSTVVARNLQPI